jgi:hypothetical protein
MNNNNILSKITIIPVLPYLDTLNKKIFEKIKIIFMIFVEMLLYNKQVRVGLVIRRFWETETPCSIQGNLKNTL